MIVGKLYFLFNFLQTRYFLRFKKREDLELWQSKKLKKYFKTVIPKSKCTEHKVKNIDDLRIIDKKHFMEFFDHFNTVGITFNEALAVARSSEASRNFVPTIRGCTVGLSSGTSGRQGVFLVSEKERFRWAGILLAKTLRTQQLIHIMSFWRRPLTIAFFLRASSNLYTTLNSRRIKFEFYDLLDSEKMLQKKLVSQNPDVVVAPASILMRLASLHGSGEMNISPSAIVSVAEVLEVEDQKKIERVFSCDVQQIYQATEGFLAYTCEQGELHLNESHVLFEKHWLDEERFEPIVTDFSRSSQIIARYHLNDILVIGKPCCCGRAEQRIEKVEGRSDEVFWLKSKEAGIMPVYPDLLRREFALLSDFIEEYRVIQEGLTWHVQLSSKNFEEAQRVVDKALKDFIVKQDLTLPEFVYSLWQPGKPGDKLRRLCYRGELPEYRV